jgi:hypothetical protein
MTRPFRLICESASDRLYFSRPDEQNVRISYRECDEHLKVAQVFEAIFSFWAMQCAVRMVFAAKFGTLQALSPLPILGCGVSVQR